MKDETRSTNDTQQRRAAIPLDQWSKLPISCPSPLTKAPPANAVCTQLVEKRNSPKVSSLQDR